MTSGFIHAMPCPFHTNCLTATHCFVEKISVICCDYDLFSSRCGESSKYLPFNFNHAMEKLWNISYEIAVIIFDSFSRKSGKLQKIV